jgi:hypothetical protein
MIRVVVPLVALALCCAGCPDTAKEPAASDARDAGPGEVPDDTRDNDDGADPGDGDGDTIEDAAVAGGADAGADAAQELGCPCVHGSCGDAGVCACEDGYVGELCDGERFAGDARDGELIVKAATELTTFNHAGRSCADGGDAVAYSVLGFDDDQHARISPAPAAGCLSAGDEVLIVNVQGKPNAISSVGRFEFLEVAEVSGEVVRFATPKTQFYGAQGGGDLGLGTARDSQRVVMQRVPHYENLLVPAGQTLTARAWDGVRGGILALRVKERAVIAGRLDMVSRGFQGAAQTTIASTSGYAGEGYAGLGSRGQDENYGGGGGGSGQYVHDDCTNPGNGASGAGGGHYDWGSESDWWQCAGWAGKWYGDEYQAHLGSGGGAGGTDDTLSNNPPGGEGGTGGGMIFVFAKELYVYGRIDASGAAGQGDATECLDGLGTSSCWDFSGPGGGGAGGTIRLEADQFTFEAGDIRAQGGVGGGGSDNYSTDGGNGSDGYIVIDSHGAQLPAECWPSAYVN